MEPKHWPMKLILQSGIHPAVKVLHDGTLSQTLFPFPSLSYRWTKVTRKQPLEKKAADDDDGRKAANYESLSQMLRLRPSSFHLAFVSGFTTLHRRNGNLVVLSTYLRGLHVIRLLQSFFCSKFVMWAGQACGLPVLYGLGDGFGSSGGRTMACQRAC